MHIPYKLANIPIIHFPKHSISLNLTKILKRVSHIPGNKMQYPTSVGVKWQISCIHKIPIQVSPTEWM